LLIRSDGATHMNNDLPTIELWTPAHMIVDPAQHPSRWVNIVGTVSGTAPGERVELAASLPDGRTEAVPAGPDDTRLAGRGDFNLEVDPALVADGTCEIKLQARVTAPGRKAFVAERSVCLEPATSGSPATLPGPVVVDGCWEPSGGGLRNQRMAYDRLLAYGHTGLRHYRAGATITIHRFNTEHPDYPDIGPGVGLLLRWNGHTAEAAERPRLQWRPVGALCWYRFGRDKADTVRDYRLQILGGRLGHGTVSEPIAEDTSGRKLELGRPYRFVAEVDGRDETPARYRFAVFDADAAAPGAGVNGGVHDTRDRGSPGPALLEPDQWDLTGRGLVGEREAGSLLVVAHHAEITVQDVDITELG
jgi:hypothetical protein